MKTNNEYVFVKCKNSCWLWESKETKLYFDFELALLDLPVLSICIKVDDTKKWVNL